MTERKAACTIFRVGIELSDIEVGSGQMLYAKLVGAASDDLVTHWHEMTRQSFESARARRRKIVYMLDICDAATPTPRQRRTQGDWHATHELLIREALAGIAFVVSSLLMRGAITAVAWLKPLPVPYAVFTDLDEASTWALDRLRDAGAIITLANRDDARRAFTAKAKASSG